MSRLTDGDAEVRPSCCAPARGPGGAPGRAVKVAPTTEPALPLARGTSHHLVEQRRVPGGWFAMGEQSSGSNPGDGDRPVHQVELGAFDIDATAVTNEDFAKFVTDTGHVTAAEEFGFSAVFHLAVTAREEDVIGRAPGTPWWVGVRGATWRAPGGRSSDLDGLEEHPVVHVSWDDAVAYCRWVGRRLPTEAEWERASRGGREGARFPWGDEQPGADGWRANIWQGSFPGANIAEDGWVTTAPVRSYAPNGFGLWQTVGNVWEWCSDWYEPGWYARSPSTAPQGPDHGAARVLRGGSYLCHDSYCNRYRNAARSSNTPDSSMGNAGFRTVTRRSR